MNWTKSHPIICFKNIGIGKVPGEGFKKIKVHFVFDAKADGKRRA